MSYNSVEKNTEMTEKALNLDTIHIPCSEVSQVSCLCRECFQDGLVINRNTSLHKRLSLPEHGPGHPALGAPP